MRYRRQLLWLVLAACGTAEPAPPSEREPREAAPARDAPAPTAPTAVAPTPPLAAAPPDGLYAATLQAQPTPDACRVVNGSHERAYAVVGERLEATVRHVGSTSDENTAYELVASAAAGACSAAVLVLGGQVRGPSQSLGGAEGCEARFALDAADADRAAALFGVTRADRVELGPLVRGRLSMSQTSFRAGDPVTAQLTIENPAAGVPVRVYVIDDPRLQWNVRLTGTRDDAARVQERTDLPIGVSVFGGTQWRTLSPGRDLSQPIWISAQLDLSTPGRYRIGVVVDVELAPAEGDPGGDVPLHRRSTRTFQGTVSFEVL